MAQLIGVVGYECEDIIIYLAGILHSFGKKTAIVDRTEQELLSEMLGIRKKEEQVVREYCGIGITNQGSIGDAYDVVFYLFGYRLGNPKMLECNNLLMITDGFPAHAALLEKVHKCECRKYLLIRNLVNLKHKVEYLAMLADIREDYSEIPYDERDIRQRCSLSSYSGFEIKRLSAGMKKALLEVILFLFDEYSEKKVWGAMKKM